MRSPIEELLIRQDAFRWLAARAAGGAYELSREDLLDYRYLGERIPLIDRNRGIRNPVDFTSTLSIMTSTDGPYSDAVGSNGLLSYAYRTGDGGDNVKLRRAVQERAPLIHFERVRPGAYIAHYPVYAIAGDPAARTVVVALDESLRFIRDPGNPTVDEREYAERVVRQRMHQPLFRSRVLHAYEGRCAVCALRHLPLLDAAHIIGDTEADGLALTPNGLALCKIHHAAYDRDILGISPDHRVHIAAAVMREVDGPMLRHGIEEMDGRRLSIPRRRQDAPSAERLATRFARFAAAQ